MCLPVRKSAAYAHDEHCTVFLGNMVLAVFRRKFRIHLEKLFRMDEENVFRQLRGDLRELHEQLVLCHLDGFVYAFHCLLEELEIPVLSADYFLPVPLVYVY